MRTAVHQALKAGYRHLDCALIYQNEKEVGEGIKDSGIARSDIFITSKVWNTHQTDVKAGLQQTLEALGTDYLDLYVSPSPLSTPLSPLYILPSDRIAIDASLSIGPSDLSP